jgi:hypothetical protein
VSWPVVAFFCRVSVLFLRYTLRKTLRCIGLEKPRRPPIQMAIGPLGIWSYSVLETWNSPSTTQENVCETQGLHGGDRIPQSQVSRTEKDSGLVGSTIYYDFEEY